MNIWPFMWPFYAKPEPIRIKRAYLFLDGTHNSDERKLLTKCLLDDLTQKEAEEKLREFRNEKA